MMTMIATRTTIPRLVDIKRFESVVAPSVTLRVVAEVRHGITFVSKVRRVQEWHSPRFWTTKALGSQVVLVPSLEITAEIRLISDIFQVPAVEFDDIVVIIEIVLHFHVFGIDSLQPSNRSLVGSNLVCIPVELVGIITNHETKYQS